MVMLFEGFSISLPYESDVKSVVGVSPPPIGLAYLASVLRDEHDVEVLDANALGYGLDDVRRELKKFYPDVVGITVNLISGMVVPPSNVNAPSDAYG